MKILFHLTHPANVHLFKNTLWNLQKNHEVRITARDKDVLLKLLDNYNFKYEKIGGHYKGLSKFIGLVKMNHKLLKIAREFKPQIIIGGPGNLYVSHVSALLDIPSILFDDTELSIARRFLFVPFTDAICTPSCFNAELGKKQIRYDGYKEIAYLHPKYFTPNSSVLNELNLSKDEKFFILRFVSWEAHHDIGEKGLGLKEKRKLIKGIENYGRVLITSESKLPEEFEKYKITIPVEKIHDLLYFAEMYIGEGGTMASECSILGTPWIFISSLKTGYLKEQKERYSLGFSFSDGEKAIEKALQLIKIENLKKQWKEKKEILLKEKIDVTSFMIWFIENYPESFKIMRENLNYQENFR